MPRTPQSQVRRLHEGHAQRSRIRAAAKFIVGVWRNWMELHKWAIIVMSIVAVLSGEILSIGGLALLAVIALYFGLRRLGRWADAED